MAVIFHVADSYTLLLDSLGKYILECKIILEPIICYYIAQILLKSHQTYGCSWGSKIQRLKDPHECNFIHMGWI